MTSGIPPDPADRLTLLTDRLQRLSAMALPGPARALVTEALSLAFAVQDRAPPFIDMTTFTTLLELAGPEVAPELLHQLAEDLTGVHAKLATALGTKDHVSVRAQTHILMALAGSVGAGALYEDATALNLAAHGTDDLAQGGAQVMAGLAHLRQFIDDARTASQ